MKRLTVIVATADPVAALALSLVMYHTVALLSEIAQPKRVGGRMTEYDNSCVLRLLNRLVLPT